MDVGLAVTEPSGPVATLSAMPEDPIGLSEVAALLGVSKMTASRYALRDDFPTPSHELARGRLWSKKAVERWAARTLPLPRAGRPRKTGK